MTKTTKTKKGIIPTYYNFKPFRKAFPKSVMSPDQPVIFLHSETIDEVPDVDIGYKKRSIFDGDPIEMKVGEKIQRANASPLLPTMVKAFIHAAKSKGFQFGIADRYRYGKDNKHPEHDFPEEAFVNKIVEHLKNDIYVHEIHIATVDEILNLIKKEWISKLTQPAGPITIKKIMSITWRELSETDKSEICQQAEYQNYLRPCIPPVSKRDLNSRF